ncbi:LysR family transcriptional regulator [Streptomyces zhihengii]|uniref:LysR family transcriptional regulator n=1 Tax=Streptomyces zhihengii TaxID=1818004 RepID=A0ABS2V3Q6_9ACTN|nr:LysR family transcriptional regulator [Streptomyces zhihengii]
MRVERARYFLAALRTGSLRSAAADCGVSQPTIGQQLTVLEVELDVVLLTRSPGGVRATPAGEALIAPFTRLVAAEDAVREAALATNGTYQGRVSIGGGSVTVETVVAPVVGRLLAEHPGLRFSVREGPSGDIERSVLSGDIGPRCGHHARRTTTGRTRPPPTDDGTARRPHSAGPPAHPAP